MIITKTPFRVSLCGGGSDLPAFYEKNGGCVISTTIKKYMYITYFLNRKLKAGRGIEDEVSWITGRTWLVLLSYILALWDPEVHKPGFDRG